jgi:hypothetical protein
MSKPTYTIYPLFIMRPSTPDPLSTPIRFPHLYLTLIEPQEPPLGLQQRRRRENLTFDLQGRRAKCHRSGTSLSPLSACQHPTDPELPNPTLLLVQGRRSRDPCKPRSSSSMADAQICIRAPSSSMLTIPGVVVERRAAPSPPRRRGKPPGELQPPPAPG